MEVLFYGDGFCVECKSLTLTVPRLMGSLPEIVTAERYEGPWVFTIPIER